MASILYMPPLAERRELLRVSARNKGKDKNLIAEVYFNTALSFDEVNDLHQAIKYYKLALDHNPRHVIALNSLAVVYCHTCKFDEALEHYLKVLEVDPKNFDAHIGLGYLAERRWKTGEAKKYYLDAVALNPCNQRANASAARILDRLCEYMEAMKYWAKYLRLGGGEDEAEARNRLQTLVVKNKRKGGKR